MDQALAIGSDLLRCRPGPARFDGGADAATRPEFPPDHSPHRIASLDDVIEDLVNDILLKDSKIPIT